MSRFSTLWIGIWGVQPDPAAKNFCNIVRPNWDSDLGRVSTFQELANFLAMPEGIAVIVLILLCIFLRSLVLSIVLSVVTVVLAAIVVVDSAVADEYFMAMQEGCVGHPNAILGFLGVACLFAVLWAYKLVRERLRKT